MHWREITVEDSRGNPTTVRIKTSMRGVAVLVPARAAASVLHLSASNIDALANELRPASGLTPTPR